MTSAAVVLLSGGLDSSTALAATLADGADVPLAVTVNYGQRHLREITAAREVAEHYRVPHLVLDLRGYGQSVTSALTGSAGPVPEGHYTDATMAATVVPGRNAVLLSAAAGIAESVGAQRVVIAAHSGDHPIYPDCRPEFITRLSAALNTAYRVTVSAPFMLWSKSDIAATARELDVPIARTWSCYVGGDVHCGRCGTCVERAEALHPHDPTAYADPDYWRTVTV